MRLASIQLKQPHVALLPDRFKETETVVIPVTYLGNGRWRARQVPRGQIHYISSKNILRLATTTEVERAKTSGRARAA